MTEPRREHGVAEPVEAVVVRSSLTPLGQAYVFTLPGQPKTIVVPGSVDDETFAKLEAAVEAHNAFERTAFERTVALIKRLTQ